MNKHTWLWLGMGCHWLASGIAPALSQPAITQLNGIQVVRNGLWLSVSGSATATITRVEAPDRLVVDLPGVTLRQGLHRATIPINRFGVQQARLAQFQSRPPIARVVLDLDATDAQSTANWQTYFDPIRRVLLLQPEAVATAPPPVPDSAPPSNEIATLQSLFVSSNGSIVIQADQPITFSGTNDLATNSYNLTISRARIAPQFSRPTLAANSPIEGIRITPVGESVIIGIRYVNGATIQEGRQADARQVALRVVSQNSPPSTPVSPPPMLPPTLPQTTVPASPTNRGRGVVVVDAGHGGRDVGAVGNGVFEKDIVLAMSLRLGQRLQRLGFAVVYTRTTDVEIDLEPRVEMASRVQGDVFISMHANSLAARSQSVSGVETFYAPRSQVGQELATLVQSEIIAATRAVDRGAKTARFFVLVRTPMPSILVETGFVTNPTEAANLNTPAYQERIAEAIARERRAGLQSLATYEEFAGRSRRNADDLVALLKQIKAQGQRVFALGAPVKGNTLLNYCRWEPGLIECATEVNQFKIGRLTPGTHIPIVDERTLTQQPDYYLILSWNFLDYLIGKYKAYLLAGGKFIVPVPEVRVLSFEVFHARDRQP